MFTNLRYIDLTFSNIEIVEEFAFDDNRKLEVMLLSGNRIEGLPNLFTDEDHALGEI